MTAAIRRYLFENPSKFDPRDFLKPAREAADASRQGALPGLRLRRPGRENQDISLEKMAERYKKGELAQIVK
jgi:fructose-bisphosphate aldolase class II